MSVKYGKFEMPEKVLLEEEGKSTTFARFVAEPCERGFGHTIGNSLRRIMMTSLEAPAAVSFQMEGVPHEYMAVEGIIEDVTNIILNLKGALFRKLPRGDEPHTRSIETIHTAIDVTQEQLDENQGQVSIRLGDLVKQGSFEVVNPELHLFTVTRPMKKKVSLRVAIGRGYVSSERIHVPEKKADEIVIDAIFSPVRLVNYSVENTRVGQDTDYDRLILEVRTDGRVTPTEALSFAAQIAMLQFDSFKNIQEESLVFEEAIEESDDDENELLSKLALRIDEIELSVRSTNCLSGANIQTIAQLVSIPEKKMLEFRNFGKKSLNEIKDKLREMGLSLGMDLSRYGITPENIEERIAQFQKERRAFAEESLSEDDEEYEEDEEEEEEQF